MTSPVLFYAPGTCALASIVALEWLGEPYRLCRIDPENFGGEQFERINPLGQVPVLYLGDRLLGQNNAVLNFIAQKNPELKLAPPAGTTEYLRYLEALGYVNSNLHSALSTTFSVEILSDDPEAQADIKKHAIRIAHEQLAYAEKFLVPKGYLFGRPTVFEAYLFAIGRWPNQFHLFETKKDFPRFTRFLDQFTQIPAVQFALQIEKDGNAQSRGGFQGHIELGEVLSHLGAGTLSHFKTLTSTQLLRHPPGLPSGWIDQSQAV